jgi:hypothetical protein
MVRTISISQRIAQDRGGAGFWAFIASLPAVAAVLGFLYLGYLALSTPEDLADDNGYIWLVAIVLFAFMFFSVARWTYDAVRAGLTPQRVQAMWLRRFQAEKGNAFRTSRVIDRLSRDGISAITLQDRDVRLSFEQRRNRLAPTFWFFFVPIALGLSYLGYVSYQDAQTNFANQELPETANLLEALVQALVVGIAQGVFLIILIGVFVLAVMAAALLFFVVAALAGPVGAIFSGKRDEFRTLPRLLERLQRGKGRRGAAIVRISDEHWREAVTSSLGAVDVAIIDLSDVTEHVAWEIGEAVRACGRQGLVFLCRKDARLSEAARAAVRNALGREPTHIISYPAKRGGDAEKFARALREQICSAADLRAATKA